MGVIQQTNPVPDDTSSISELPSYEASQARAHAPLDRELQIPLLSDDGRVSIEINHEVVTRTLPFISEIQSERLQSNAGEQQDFERRAVKLNIVMQVVGSRGDVQPFIPLARSLQQCGHRVRLATHPAFQNLVEGHGIEFFSVGGDPTDLMAYMVKNPGLMPKIMAFRPGEVQRRRKMMRSIVRAFWRSCYENDVRNAETDQQQPRSITDAQNQRRDSKPFVADVIIANPPSLAHIHIAERLSIPLHIVFTMPWTPTQSFPHPLANINSAESDAKVANYLSFILVDAMIWQGLGDQINRFRIKDLGLEPIQPTQAPGLVDRLRIPHTYCWSPSLVPKPVDWNHNITVTGPLFLPLASQFQPPKALVEFLRKGTTPIYVGFGSVEVEDPQRLTNIVLQAIQSIGILAIVSKGRGNLGGDILTSAHDVYSLEECPHDWLFPRVACVVHHGGSGTTAAGVAAGKPTVVVPFFGDQPFWGNMIYKAGAGPKPVAFKELTSERLASAILEALEPQMRENAIRLKTHAHTENGMQMAIDAFHTNLPVQGMQCSLIPDRAAVWQMKKKDIRLCDFAATVLKKEKLLKWDDLKLCQSVDYNVATGPLDPFSGALWTIGDLLYDAVKGCGEIVGELFRVPLLGQRVWEQNTLSRQKSMESQITSSTSSQSTPVLDIISSSSTPGKPKWVGYYIFKGTGRICRASVRAPGAFCTAMAQGAHNTPRLWGDKTVRPQPKIEGFTSGVAEGCKELTYGIYDGIAGLFAQPVIGAVEDGAFGFVKGIGKGIAGAPVKFLAGASGIAGYPLKGVDVAVTKAVNGDPLKPVRSMHMAQGEADFYEALDSEKQSVIERWHASLRRSKDRKGKQKAT